MSTPILCLAAPRGCGKDTLFTCLRKLNPACCRFAFADSLKADLQWFIAEQFGIDVWTCTGAQKELIRPILIAYGCAQREVDIDYWVKRVIAQIEASDRGAIPVITDVRFVSEYECLKRAFGDSLVLINIERDGAPPPTDEEMKHSHKVAALAHHTLRWGNDTDEEQLAHAKRVLEWVGL